MKYIIFPKNMQVIFAEMFIFRALFYDKIRHFTNETCISSGIQFQLRNEF